MRSRSAREWMTTHQVRLPYSWRGSALFVALGLMVLLFGLAMVFSLLTDREGQVVRDQSLQTRARMVAQSGLETVMGAEDYPSETSGRVPATLSDGSDQFVVRTRDHNAKIDVNSLSPNIASIIDTLYRELTGEARNPGTAAIIGHPSRRTVRRRDVDGDQSIERVYHSEVRPALVFQRNSRNIKGGYQSVGEVRRKLNHEYGRTKGKQIFQVLKPFMTIHRRTWVDEHTIWISGKQQRQEQNHLQFEPRAPINVNKAALPLLVAVVRGIQATVSEIRPSPSLKKGYRRTLRTIPDPRYMPEGLDLEIARKIARRIHSYVRQERVIQDEQSRYNGETGPIETWREFEAFVHEYIIGMEVDDQGLDRNDDGLLDPGVGYLLLAHFCPYPRSSRTVPEQNGQWSWITPPLNKTTERSSPGKSPGNRSSFDRSVGSVRYATIEKTSVSSYTTEFCFHRGGYLTIRSTGEVRDRTETIRARATVSALVRTHRIRKISTRQELRGTTNSSTPQPRMAGRGMQVVSAQDERIQKYAQDQPYSGEVSFDDRMIQGDEPGHIRLSPFEKSMRRTGSEPSTSTGSEGGTWNQGTVSFWLKPRRPINALDGNEDGDLHDQSDYRVYRDYSVFTGWFFHRVNDGAISLVTPWIRHARIAGNDTREGPIRTDLDLSQGAEMILGTYTSNHPMWDKNHDPYNPIEEPRTTHTYDIKNRYWGDVTGLRINLRFRPEIDQRKPLPHEKKEKHQPPGWYLTVGWNSVFANVLSPVQRMIRLNGLNSVRSPPVFVSKRVGSGTSKRDTKPLLRGAVRTRLLLDSSYLSEKQRQKIRPRPGKWTHVRMTWRKQIIEDQQLQFMYDYADHSVRTTHLDVRVIVGELWINGVKAPVADRIYYCGNYNRQDNSFHLSSTLHLDREGKGSIDWKPLVVYRSATPLVKYASEIDDPLRNQRESDADRVTYGLIDGFYIGRGAGEDDLNEHPFPGRFMNGQNPPVYTGVVRFREGKQEKTNHGQKPETIRVKRVLHTQFPPKSRYNGNHYKPGERPHFAVQLNGDGEETAQNQTNGYRNIQGRNGSEWFGEPLRIPEDTGGKPIKIQDSLYYRLVPVFPDYRVRNVTPIWEGMTILYQKSGRNQLLRYSWRNSREDP